MAVNVKVKDKYGFELPLHSLLLGGITNTETPEQRLMKYIDSTAANSAAKSQTAPAVPIYGNSMSRINPYYTQQQPMDALSPLAMYQQYKQTGVMPQQQSSFTPYTPQAPVYVPGAPQQASTAPKVTGGK